MMGKIIQISKDFETKGILVTLLLTDVPVQELQVLKQFDRLSVSLKRWREKRSRDANAYYWKLVTKLADVTGHSNNRIHNTMLDRYGVLETLQDGSLIPICMREDIDFMEFSSPHLKPTQKTLTKNDVRYRWYFQIKGSSLYDTKEMSRLIDGLVEECREQGIETLPPAEIERMMAAYEKKHSN